MSLCHEALCHEANLPKFSWTSFIDPVSENVDKTVEMLTPGKKRTGRRYFRPRAAIKLALFLLVMELIGRDKYIVIPRRFYFHFMATGFQGKRNVRDHVKCVLRGGARRGGGGGGEGVEKLVQCVDSCLHHFWLKLNANCRTSNRKVGLLMGALGFPFSEFACVTLNTVQFRK